MQDIYLLSSLTNFKNSIDKTNKANDDVMQKSMVDRKMETIIKDLNTLKGIMLDKNYKIT